MLRVVSILTQRTGLFECSSVLFKCPRSATLISAA
jgi:hypothetical protein